jgi:predicted dithiol-disulfide oxidoreductase (DUF899 family)
METHTVVSRKEWIAARRALLVNEKELTRAHDRVSAERRTLPWVKVEEPYVFDGPKGRETLADLFGGRSQLIVYHFMFGPGWREGCTGCSFVADHIDGANLHLQHHDVSLVAVSRAPWREFQEFKERMGWRFKWVSSHGSDFNYDYGVSFTKEQVATGDVGYNYGTSNQAHDDLHGLSVFHKDATGAIFHTYSSYARGVDILLGAHNYLDLTPRGRNETTTKDWVRHHDKYDGAAARTANGPHAESDDDCCGAGRERVA